MPHKPLQQLRRHTPHLETGAKDKPQTPAGFRTSDILNGVKKKKAGVAHKQRCKAPTVSPKSFMVSVGSNMSTGVFLVPALPRHIEAVPGSEH